MATPGPVPAVSAADGAARRVAALSRHARTAACGPAESAGTGSGAGTGAGTSTSGDGLDLDVLIVGAGFSGLLAAIKLVDAKLFRPSRIRIVDAASEAGGVWTWCTYPGAACDVDSYYYLPMLGRTKHVPSKRFVSQREIKAYAKLLARTTGVYDLITFDTRVTSLHYSLQDMGGAAPSGATAPRVSAGAGGLSPHWTATLANQSTGTTKETVTARFCVLAMGPISVPQLPRIPGLADRSFAGPVMHTARWDHSVPLKGKRVGVIGTGASAGQVIVELAKADSDVEHLYVFQRTPAHVVPRDDKATTAKFAARLLAKGNDDLRERNVRWIDGPEAYEAFNDPVSNKQLCAFVEAEIRSRVVDPAVADLLVPKHKFWAKRVLVLDGYYEAFNSPNVTLIADPGGVVRAHENSVETADGRIVEVDVLICATGFDVGTASIADVTGRNRDGGVLADHMGDHPGSVFGIHIPEFPNAFIMCGPQSLNPLLNVTYVSEKQAEYITQVIRDTVDSGAKASVDVTHAARRAWARTCERVSAGTVWGSVRAWYNRWGNVDLSGVWWGKYCEYEEAMRELRARGGVYVDGGGRRDTA